MFVLKTYILIIYRLDFVYIYLNCFEKMCIFMKLLIVNKYGKKNNLLSLSIFVFLIL